MRIDNDIQSSPRLTVEGIVIVLPRLFTDRSRTLRNMTVKALQGGKLVEQHSCVFVDAAKGEEYFLGRVNYCGRNGSQTRFYFKKLDVSINYKFSIKACNSAGCAVKMRDHNTQNW